MATNIVKTRLPDLELSYDKTLHKKVRADAFQILPKGKKCMLWFTYKLHENVALLLSFDKTEKYINNVETIMMTFSDDLAMGDGTILTGVILSSMNQNIFCCRDIHYYQGEHCEKCNYEIKYKYISDMLENYTDQTAIDELKLTILTTAIITKEFTDAISIARSLPYDVYGLSSIRFDRYYSLGITPYTQISEPIGYFKVKAQVRCDIYNLFVHDAAKPHGIAAVTDYKQSVMLNSLFRDIKENRNLDLLEMSDDEDVFENIDEDKYVDLKKSYVMKCSYNARFRKWRPIEVCKGQTRLSTKADILAIEKKSLYSLYDKHNSSRCRSFHKS